MKNLNYSVFETFHSFQGEGEHSGRSAFFIRLYGCPIQCPWCDSAGTWLSAGESDVQKMSPEALAEAAATAHPDFAVITGGEPTIHDLSPLCKALHAKNIPVHLETSGAFPLRGEFDWITISPKTKRLPLSENWARASELKLIITEPEDIGFWIEKISRERVPETTTIRLHPEWSQHRNPAVLSAIADCVCRRGHPFRAGWQLHKLFDVR